MRRAWRMLADILIPIFQTADIFETKGKLMAQKLYVGNLAFSLTSEELGGLFGEHGKVVSAKVITERETGRSRGFGFVEFDIPSSGANAIRELNGKNIGGRPLVVREAEDRPEGGGGGGGRGGGVGRPRGGRRWGGRGWGRLRRRWRWWRRRWRRSWRRWRRLRWWRRRWPLVTIQPDLL